MQVQKQWTKPELIVYGSVEKITEQINATKQVGSGDSIQVTIPGQGSTTIGIPGGQPTGLYVL
ncbi:MAG: hypothetical protein HC815_38840 [Richelia sp. RM1_1_1]|nr:hypothetical protein [Richelia sp. RM1_1_1]